MKTNVLFLFMLAGVMVSVVLGAAVTSTVTATANNVLISGNRTCGACTQLVISSAPLVGSLLRFDLSSLPSDADITAATLGIGISATGSGSPQVEIYEVEGSWVQSIVTSSDPLTGNLALDGEPTWELQSSPNVAWTNGGGRTDTRHFQKPITTNTLGSTDLSTLSSANFLTLVRSWKSTPATNYGLSVIVRTGTTGVVWFGARNNADVTLRPTLTLTYNTEVGAPPPPIVPQNYANPVGGVGLRVPSRYASSSTSGAIVGGVIGGIAALMLIIAIATIILRN